ncbi:MAG TPA: ABC transporter ATP-binding protein, partial [Gemmataceae bacterium]|nr:ABC transporter ATP-binding protein [Gemmataceae bacterium]
FKEALAVDRVSLEIKAGELFFLLGPSGCGKTTLLRTLAGFVQPDTGSLHFGSENITNLPPRSRGAGMVFQTYALWPHMSVAKNVAYGLKVRGLASAEVNRRVDQALKMVRMPGFGDRRPNELSGGQQQRIALARALVIEPRVILLDEPLSNLDARLRDEMREEIRRLHQETGLTMIYVTHDQKEALSLADRLAVMKEGRLVQVGKPDEVYHHPTSPFVAGFLGDINLIPGKVVDIDGNRVGVETAVGRLKALRTGDPFRIGSQVQCAVRPASLSPGENQSDANTLKGIVEQASFTGDLLQVRVLAEKDTVLSIAALPSASNLFRPGALVTLRVPIDQVIVLPDDIS